jgi:hypothetical protein
MRLPLFGTLVLADSDGQQWMGGSHNTIEQKLCPLGQLHFPALPETSHL